MKLIFLAYILVPLFDSIMGNQSKICNLPKVVGPCYAAHQRFYYNPAAKKCSKFVYGGCRGNENNFLSIVACEAACKGK